LTLNIPVGGTPTGATRRGQCLTAQHQFRQATIKICRISCITIQATNSKKLFTKYKFF